MQTQEWPAPTKGWVQSGTLVTASADQAEVLDNFFPTAQSVRLRRGSTQFADLGASVKRLMTYSQTTDDLLASTDTSVFDVVRVNGDSDNTWAEWEGQASGDWSTTQISTSGGEFLVAFNGTNHAWYYDGSAINPITTVAVNDLAFDAETAAFTIGQTVTGGTSGAVATILGISKSGAAAGTLKVGAITGTFQDNETITDGATGSATSNIPSGTSSASSVAITGVATSAISQAWLFKERIFMVEKGTQSVWYLPVKSIGGAATEINLGSVFKRGGPVLFGATWSVDSGSGLDDVCVFVTSNGEVAIYQGTDPSSASTWALAGIYDIGKPIDKHAFFKAGGDLAVMTKDGIVPISQAPSKDRAALAGQAITFPIEDAWQEAVADTTSSYPITATLWQANTMLVVGVPTTDGGTNVAYVANARTGAWCRYTGWDVRCSAVASNELYFGSNDGKVYKGETGGTDAGASYTGICVPKFSGFSGAKKFLTRAFVMSKAAVSPTIKLKGLNDYTVPDIALPATTPVPDDAVWGTGVWGDFVWGGTSERAVFRSWKKVSGSGQSISIAALVTSNNVPACDVELLGFKARYEVGSEL